MTAATRHLAAVPERARRVLGIIRVSDEGDRGDDLLSPAIQRTAITDYCATKDYELANIIEAIDESGSQARSPWWRRLDEAVSAVEAGEYDGIVVWKFSRAGRRRLKWAVALDRIETAGGILESATEQFDTTTSAGRLARGMLAEMNAFQADVIGDGWREAHAARIRSGRPSTGKPRYGYTYDKKQKLHVPDPETGPILADLYRRYISGESIYSLVKWLNGHGYRTTAGGYWTDVRLRTVLDSGFAAGKFMAGGDPQRKIKPTLHDGIHQALITDEQWQAYLDARGVRRSRPARRERSQYLLSGLVRCARCGGAMTASKPANNERREGPRYRCQNGKSSSGFSCSGSQGQCRTVEAHIVEWLQEQAEKVDEQAERLERAGEKPARVAALEADVERLAREVNRVDESMSRLVVQNAERPLPATVYAKALGELEDRRAQLVDALELAEREQRRTVVDVPATAAGLLAEWDMLTVPQRREILAGLIDCVLVRGGRPPFMRVVEFREVRP